MCKCRLEIDSVRAMKLGRSSDLQSILPSNMTLTRQTSRVRSWRRCLIAAATLLLIPKCPACFAAGVLCTTGFGLSIPVAGMMRSMLIGFSVFGFAWWLYCLAASHPALPDDARRAG